MYLKGSCECISMGRGVPPGPPRVRASMKPRTTAHLRAVPNSSRVYLSKQRRKELMWKGQKPQDCCEDSAVCFFKINNGASVSVKSQLGAVSMTWQEQLLGQTKQKIVGRGAPASSLNKPSQSATLDSVRTEAGALLTNTPQTEQVSAVNTWKHVGVGSFVFLLLRIKLDSRWASGSPWKL